MKTLKKILPLPLMNRLHRFRAKAQTAKNHYALQREMGDRSGWRDVVSALSVFVRSGKTILFFPERPPRRFAAYDHCAFMGYTISKDPSVRFDAVIFRKNHTFADPAVLEQVSVPLSKVINGRCLDISKHRVGRVFAEVFGYEMDVDPLLYCGSMVEKSDANGAHDGRVIQGPISEEEVRAGSVYQKLIESRSDRDGFFLDIRVPIHAGRVPLVYLKHTPVGNRFKDFAHTEFKEPGDVFSLEEQNLLSRMAQTMGLDCGDFDVLRDLDGRIYVVDANNTPMTHIENLPTEQKRAALTIMAASFERIVQPRI